MFLKMMFIILKSCMTFTMICDFCPKEQKLIKLKNLLLTCIIKKCVIHIRNLKQALSHGLVLQKVHSY